MLFIQKNKPKIASNKKMHQSTNKNKSKSTQKSLNKNTQSQSLLKKSDSIHGKYSPIPTTTVSTHKQKSLNHFDKNTKKPSQYQSHESLSSNNKSKQFHTKAQNSKQKKQVKYIFNPLTNSKNRNSLTINRQKQHSLSQTKSYSNQTSTKHVPSQFNDVSSFAKSIEPSKMKKKSFDYIKSFNKTSVCDKVGSRLQNTLVNQMNQTCKYGKTWAHGDSFKNLRQIKITDEQLEEVNVEMGPKISQIRQNVNNLFKKLKSPNRNKLLLITNNYQRIVSQLYQKINSQQNHDESYNLSSIQHNHSSNFTNNGKNQTIPCNKIIKQNVQNIVKINDSSSSTSAMIEDDSDTEHWDSYLQIDLDEKENKRNVFGSNCKQNLVKKLNLGNINKTQIKQYQDEFMDNQQIFSESWKRQISQQKRF